jgi:hypothetical protein
MEENELYSSSATGEGGGCRVLFSGCGWEEVWAGCWPSLPALWLPLLGPLSASPVGFRCGPAWKSLACPRLAIILFGLCSWERSRLRTQLRVVLLTFS